MQKSDEWGGQWCGLAGLLLPHCEVGKWLENGLKMVCTWPEKNLLCICSNQGKEGILGLTESESGKDLLCIFRRGNQRRPRNFGSWRKFWVSVQLRGGLDIMVHIWDLGHHFLFNVRNFHNCFEMILCFCGSRSNHKKRIEPPLASYSSPYSSVFQPLGRTGGWDGHGIQCLNTRHSHTALVL